MCGNSFYYKAHLESMLMSLYFHCLMTGTDQVFPLEYIHCQVHHNHRDTDTRNYQDYSYIRLVRELDYRRARRQVFQRENRKQIDMHADLFRIHQYLYSLVRLKWLSNCVNFFSALPVSIS